MADINQRYMDTVLEPWEQEPGLAPLIPNFRAVHCVHVQDNESLHVREMAATAFAYETMIAQSTVTMMEREGTLVKGRKPTAKKGATAKPEIKAGTDAEQQAVQMGCQPRHSQAVRPTPLVWHAMWCKARLPTMPLETVQ